MFALIDEDPDSAKTTHGTSIPELLIQILEHLPLRDLIAATHVNQHWRSLVPAINSPIRLRLLGLAFSDAESPYPVSLRNRISYVDMVETDHAVVIPEPYRTILGEWPASQPPPGMHWPHSVRFHVSGFCFCDRHMLENPDQCGCAGKAVQKKTILIPENVFKIVMNEGRVPKEEDLHWELFDKPVRLYTDQQNSDTMRLIRLHPVDNFEWNGRWAKLEFKTLQLSRYHFHTEDGTSDGIFVLMLEGLARGQIHAWSSDGSQWYDGFEAESFWDWNYVEWDRDAVEETYGMGSESGE